MSPVEVGARCGTRSVVRICINAPTVSCIDWVGNEVVSGNDHALQIRMIRNDPRIDDGNDRCVAWARGEACQGVKCVGQTNQSELGHSRPELIRRWPRQIGCLLRLLIRVQLDVLEAARRKELLGCDDRLEGESCLVGHAHRRFMSVYLPAWWRRGLCERRHSAGPLQPELWKLDEHRRALCRSRLRYQLRFTQFCKRSSVGNTRRRHPWLGNEFTRDKCSRALDRLCGIRTGRSRNRRSPSQLVSRRA